MKILQIIDERWDSGLTHHALMLSRSLRTAGHDVVVGAHAGKPAYEAAEKMNLSLLRIGGRLSFIRDARKIRFDVVHAHTGSAHVMGIGITLGTGTVLIRTRGDARPLRKRLGTALLYGRTDAVIVPSRLIETQYRAVLDWPASKLHTIYPGIPVPDFVPEPQGPVRVGLVGRLDPVKGHEDFLAAVREISSMVPDAEFIVAGEEKNIKTSFLSSLAAELKIEKRIVFLGWQKDILSFMKSCHIGVVASVGSETISRVCMEWFSCGRPVVGTAVGCLPDILASGVNGFLVPPRNPRILGQCILEMIRRPDNRREMGRRAHDMALDRFSIDSMRRQTDFVYEMALQNRSRT